MKGITAEEKLSNILCSSSFRNNYSKLYQLEQMGLQITIFIAFYFCTTKHTLHSTKLVQERVSKIRYLLPHLLKLI